MEKSISRIKQRFKQQMDLENLKNHLNNIALSLSDSDKKLLIARLEGLSSAFPFSEYEYTLMFLRDKTVITFNKYEKLRKVYFSTNKNLELFGLAPRIFGEICRRRTVLHRQQMP